MTLLVVATVVVMAVAALMVAVEWVSGRVGAIQLTGDGGDAYECGDGGGDGN